MIRSWVCSTRSTISENRDFTLASRKVSDYVPAAIQIAGPFDVVKLAKRMPGEVRRWLQNETLGHHSRKNDLLHNARRNLVVGVACHTHDNTTEILELLALRPETRSHDGA